MLLIHLRFNISMLVVAMQSQVLLPDLPAESSFSGALEIIDYQETS